MRFLLLLLLTSCATPETIVQWKVAECKPVEIIVQVDPEMTKPVIVDPPDGRAVCDLVKLAKSRKEALLTCNAQLYEIGKLK